MADCSREWFSYGSSFVVQNINTAEPEFPLGFLIYLYGADH